jgi:hypothetical protein
MRQKRKRMRSLPVNKPAFEDSLQVNEDDQGPEQQTAGMSE